MFMPLKYAEKSISFILEEGLTPEAKDKLLKKQVHAINKQVKVHQNDWDRNQISKAFLHALCDKILTIQIEKNLPEFGPKRVMWTDIQQLKPAEEVLDSVVYKNRVIHSSGSLFCDVVVWRQKKQRSLIKSITVTEEQLRREKYGTRRFSVKEIDLADNEEDLKNLSSTDPRRIVRKTFEQFDAFMITFHRKSPAKPTLRRVVVSLTPVDDVANYTKRMQMIDWETDQSKQTYWEGASDLNSYGYVPITDASGVKKRALIEISLKATSIRSALGDICRVHRLQGVIPIMIDIIKTFIPQGDQIQIVWRRISMSFIKVHEEINEDGEKIYHARLPKNDYKCDEGTDLLKAPWVKPIDQLSLIEYIAPENLKKMNLKGVVEGYIAQGSEDIWAAGIVFFQLVWKGQEPEFFPLLRLLSEISSSENPSQELFDDKKREFENELKLFHHKHHEEAESDPLKYIILKMLHPDPEKRISAFNCLQKLKALMQIYH